MDVKLTITNTLDDNFWGFSDLLDDLGPDATDDEIRAAILELIHEDNWSVVDPDDGAIWTVSIDGDTLEWQARAEAAERRVAELESQLAAQAWRPVVADRFNIPHDRPEFGENVELLITGFLNCAGQWVYNDDLPGFRTPVIGWRPIDPPAPA